MEVNGFFLLGERTELKHGVCTRKRVLQGSEGALYLPRDSDRGKVSGRKFDLLERTEYIYRRLSSRDVLIRELAAPLQGGKR